MKIAHIFAYVMYENWEEGTYETNEDYLVVPKVNLKEVLSTLKERVNAYAVTYDSLREILDSIDMRVMEDCPSEYHSFTVKVIVVTAGYYDSIETDIIVMSDREELGRELFETLKSCHESFKDMLNAILNFAERYNLDITVSYVGKGIGETEYYHIIMSLNP